MSVCAPGRYDSKNDTCFTLDQLMEMSKAYNRYLTKQKLKPNKTKQFNVGFIKIKSNKQHLLNELKKRFDTVCQDEQCLTQYEFMKEIVKEMRDDIENNFRKPGPNKPTEWLSTDDINNVMMQYESVYPDFIFLRAVPLNCDDLSFCSLFKLNFDDYIRDGYQSIGVVFNHDRHGEPGSHWVALFINLKKCEIYYCDSGGVPPFDNIQGVIDKYINFCQQKYNRMPIYKYNKKSYQKDNTECGVYSCNFIIRMLSGESFDDIVKNYLTFKEINSCRNVYFSNAPSKYSPHPLCDPN